MRHSGIQFDRRGHNSGHRVKMRLALALTNSAPSLGDEDLPVRVVGSPGGLACSPYFFILFSTIAAIEKSEAVITGQKMPLALVSSLDCPMRQASCEVVPEKFFISKAKWSRATRKGPSTDMTHGGRGPVHVRQKKQRGRPMVRSCIC